MAEFIGRMLGPYQITQELGHGGMANVYLAAQPSVGRQVAIKVLPSQFLQDRTFLERFTREVRLIAALQHPRILPIYDFGEQDGVPYIVMAYMTGGTLVDQIKESQGGMDFDEIARLVGQAAEGLDYAHEKGIIHRDFKPSNVLLDSKGNAHIADFGIAKATADTAQITGSGFIGTPAYAAPEMATSDGLSPRVDVYALGVTLYQMLTGRLPYDAETPMGVLMAHMAQPIPDVRSMRPDVPEAVQMVIDRAMAKDPGERYQTAGELAADLRRALAGEAPAQTRQAAPRGTSAAGRGSAAATSPLTIPVAGPTVPAAPPTKAARPARPAPRLPLILGGAAAVVTLAVGGIYALTTLTRGATPEATPFVPSGGGGSSIDLDLPLAESAVITTEEEEIYSFGFSPDGSRLIIGEITKLSVWDVAAGSLLFEPPSGGADGNINDVAYSPDGRYIMATIGYCVNQYDASTGEYMEIEFCDIGRQVRALAFSPDGKIIAGAGRGSILALWDMESQNLLWEGEEQEVGISDVTFSPDGSMIASSAGDASVVVWDVDSGDALYRVEVDTVDLWDVDFSPHGDQAAVGASNGTVTVFDPASGDEINVLEGNGDAVYSLAYSPDGSLLAVGTEAGLIVLYDAATGESVSEWEAHDGTITQLTWLDGSVLVSSGDDGRLVFWE